MTRAEALKEIAAIIERADARCSACDGPVTPLNREITTAELSKIYRIAKIGRYNVNWNSKKALPQ